MDQKIQPFNRFRRNSSPERIQSVGPKPEKTVAFTIRGNLKKAAAPPAQQRALSQQRRTESMPGSDSDDSSEFNDDNNNNNREFEYDDRDSQQQQQEYDDDDDEGFQEEPSSDEEESFLEQFMKSSDNQVAFSIPNVEERGRKKNIIDAMLPELPERAYSLLPDMALGWRPKIFVDQMPCPVPLYFGDKNLNMIVNNLQKCGNSTQSIAYLGPRGRTSYDLHRALNGQQRDGQYQFKQSSILLSEEILKQYKIQIVDTREASQQLETLRLFSGMNPELIAARKGGPGIHFDSLFEGGNLDLAVELSSFEYDLYIRPDTNTTGHTSAFHFKVTKAKAGQTIRFNICNLTKKISLYQRGLKPYVFSKKAKELNGSGWAQGGSAVYYAKRKNVCYGQLVSSKKQVYYTMTFDYTFERDDDEVFFAAQPAYTYSDLKNYLSLKSPMNSNLMREVKLCRSLGGLLVPQINITDYECQDIVPLEKRKTIIICARMHPGESLSTYIAQGAIEELLNSEDDEIILLRKKVIFRIIPILNVDGVIIGNSRCTFSGLDLNKQLSESDRSLVPEAFHLKRIVRKDVNANRLLAFIDVHAHAARRNCFLSGPYFARSDINFFKSRFLPYLFSQNSDFFRYKSCKFTNQATSKKENARLVVHKQFGVFHSFTLEASAGLIEDPDYPGLQTSIKLQLSDYLKLGKDLITSLSDFQKHIEMFTQVAENVDLIKMKADQEKMMMRSPQMFKDQMKQTMATMPRGLGAAGTTTAANQQHQNAATAAAVIPMNHTNYNSMHKNRKSSVSNLNAEQEFAFISIKAIFSNIKKEIRQKPTTQSNLSKNGNDSDRFSDSKMDSEDSGDDYSDEIRVGLNSNIVRCVNTFKGQFLPRENPLVNQLEEVVLELSQPIDEDDSKKKKRRRNTKSKSAYSRKEEMKLHKLFRCKFQEDYHIVALFDDIIGSAKSMSAKEQQAKNINSFIAKHFKEESQTNPSSSIFNRTSIGFNASPATIPNTIHNSLPQFEQQTASQPIQISIETSAIKVVNPPFISKTSDFIEATPTNKSKNNPNNNINNSNFKVTQSQDTMNTIRATSQHTGRNASQVKRSETKGNASPFDTKSEISLLNANNNNINISNYNSNNEANMSSIQYIDSLQSSAVKSILQHQQQMQQQQSQNRRISYSSHLNSSLSLQQQQQQQQSTNANSSSSVSNKLFAAENQRVVTVGSNLNMSSGGQYQQQQQQSSVARVLTSSHQKKRMSALEYSCDSISQQENMNSGVLSQQNDNLGHRGYSEEQVQISRLMSKKSDMRQSGNGTNTHVPLSEHQMNVTSPEFKAKGSILHTLKTTSQQQQLYLSQQQQKQQPNNNDYQQDQIFKKKGTTNTNNTTTTTSNKNHHHFPQVIVMESSKLTGASGLAQTNGAAQSVDARPIKQYQAFFVRRNVNKMVQARKETLLNSTMKH